MEWKSLEYDVRYRANGHKQNILHMKIYIGWPSAKTKREDPPKMHECVKECVKGAFGIGFDNG